MVISNWVERKLEERRIKREQGLIDLGRKEGIELGRALERERIDAEVNGDDVDDQPSSDDE